jgi:hypothetical protein
MTRRGYAIALAAAVVVLVGSLGLTLAFVAVHRSQLRDGQRFPGVTAGGWKPGMMGGPGSSQGRVGLSAAQQTANTWLSANQPGTTLGAGTQTPRGFAFPVLRNGQTIGLVVVNGRTGRVSFHESATGSATPTPTPTTTSSA